MIFMSCLHDVHIGLTMSVRPSVRMIQQENCWKDLDEIWYGRYAVGVCLKTLVFNFPQSVIPT
jgi:hypothetical protein